MAKAWRKDDRMKAVRADWSARNCETITKTDRWIMLIVTVVYFLFAVINLGTLSFPTENWSGTTGDSLTLDLGSEATVSSVWFNGSIAQGQLTLTSDDGQTLTYSQEYGDMFKWDENSLGTWNTRYITLTVNSGTVVFNEIAFFDASGALLDISAKDDNGIGLVDEQSTVPEEPSYYNGMIFDEIYHARTAYENLHNMSIYEWTHPPLGKLIIAVGVSIFGMNPFGWRIMGTLFGALMLPALYIFAKRIFKRTDYALLAMGLFALDTMHFTQTRIATIDVFAVFFIILMYFFMYEYLRLDALDDSNYKKSIRSLALSGLFFGLGVSTKWICCYAGVGLAVLLFGNLVWRGISCARSKDQEVRGRLQYFRVRTATTLALCLLFFVLIPGIIYFVSYTPYYRYQASIRDSYGLKDCLDTLMDNQRDMFNYHSGLPSTHMCQSTWYQWPFTCKSVWFYVSETNSGLLSNISSTGNPGVWWLATIAVLCLLTATATKKLKPNMSLFMLLIGILANYLPWVLVPRCVFQYHFFATVPFLILAGLYYLYDLEKRYPKAVKLKWVWLGIAAVFFILMYPAISGMPTSKAYAYFVEYWLPGGWIYYGRV